MTLKEIRTQNLKLAIVGKTESEVAAKCGHGITQQHISKLWHGMAVSNLEARILEASLELPKGWLDSEEFAKGLTSLTKISALGPKARLLAMEIIEFDRQQRT